MIGFGNFGMKRNLKITSLGDELLMMVNTSENSFYDKVLDYTSENDNIQKFIKAIREVQQVGIEPFYRPVIDPSIEGDKVVYKKGKKPAVGYSFNKWVKAVKAMPAAEGKSWKLGTEYQYYAFLVQLINQLVAIGWDVKRAIEAVVLDSKELGHYWNSKNALHDFEMTGSREFCGVCDLANTYKLLTCSIEEVGGFWVAGGYCGNFSNYGPLADLHHVDDVDNDDINGVAWLVLE